MSEALNIVNYLRVPKPLGIIHVGANSGQEIEAYQNSSAQSCVYIEPIPHIFKQLKDNIGEIPNHYAVEALCADVNGEEVEFYIASNEGQSSSMFPLGNHAKLYPHIKYVDSVKLKTRTLDSIIQEKFSQEQFDLLVLDTQGSELKVLMGSHYLLKYKIRYVFAEISEDPIYEGGCTFEEVTSFLKLYGFRVKNLYINYKNWGEAFYAKKNPEPPEPPGLNLALNQPAKQSSFSSWSKPNDSQGAVNGFKDGEYGFHTDEEENPWWQVDLQENYALTEIRVYNRIDWCQETGKNSPYLSFSRSEKLETDL
ncbi:MAG: FkbM family methyltransferase [Planktothrix sp. GU0601_MAG3]|nr:MAG: FkbM family methyltransferase [Planktothrix sp. GU0601_MAG3]